MNYKQLVYSLLLKNEANATISALIIPTSGESRQSSRPHFELDSEVIKGFEEDIKIYIYKLKVNFIMKLATAN